MTTPAAARPAPDAALRQLHRALEVPVGSTGSASNWRWTVRQRMAGVRDLLIREYDAPQDDWLSARRATMLRERTALLMRMSDLGTRVLQDPDLSGVRLELSRLLADVQHHLQRLRDLVWDDVGLELGGSE